MFQDPELKIDNEFEDLLLTDKDCNALFVPFFYRKIRRKSDGKKVMCPSCNNSVSGNVEGSPDCPYCDSVGYLWDQGIGEGWFYSSRYMTDRSIVTSYPASMSQATFIASNLIVPKNLDLRETDVVLKPKLEGKNIKVPIESDGMFKIYNSVKHSSNQQESEYTVLELVTTIEDTFKRLLK